MPNWTSPKTWSIGETITAVLLNAIRDQLLHLFEHRVPTGAMQQYGGHSAPTGWLFCDGSAVSTTTYAALFAQIVKQSTVVLTLASPGVVNWTTHGLPENAPVKFATTGALPTGLVAGTTYYVRPTISANGFSVAATPGGSAINFTGSQSGTHTAVHAPFGYVAGASTFTLPDLRQKFPLGAKTDTSGYSLGSTGGAFTAALAETNLPSHTHTLGSHQHAIHDSGTPGSSEGALKSAAAGDATTWLTDAAGGTSGSTGSGTAFAIMPPFLCLNMIIKI